MYNYWEQHYNQAVVDYPSSPLKQIGKTVNGIEVQDYHLGLIESHISESLILSDTDHLADLGCGNGLLTVRLARRVESVVGIDFTESLLKYARNQNYADNIVYQNSNLLRIDTRLLDKVNKLSMYEVLQHITYDEFSQLLGCLSLLGQDIHFFIGGIPDKEKIKKFYDSEAKYAYYLNCEAEGKPHLGRWWLESELRAISSGLGWSMVRLHQPNNLYTSYYRFDALLKKK
jgi:2-polyprenyl-3-methyl-5-hydroxy-6-metoxy-1,4-benzoquinol methylase